MFGVCFEAPGVVRWRGIEDPRLESPTDAIVAVEVAGLCGSDLHPYLGREVGLDPGTVMGHEFVGRVVAVGDEVRDVKVGDRVHAPFSTSCGTCEDCRAGLTSRCARGQLFGWRSGGVGLHGGQAERVRVPLADGTLVRVPDGVSADVALLLGDNLSTAWYCASLADIRSDAVSVVIGCGPVGLLGILAARDRGAGAIVAVDPVPERRERATTLGATAVEPDADVVRQAIASLGGERGAHSVLEFVGLKPAQRLAWEVLRPGGVMAAIGCHTDVFAFSPAEAYDKNLTYRTGRCPARAFMAQLSARVQQDLAHVADVITHRFAPEACVEAYDVFANHRDGCLKAVFDFAPRGSQVTAGNENGPERSGNRRGSGP